MIEQTASNQTTKMAKRKDGDDHHGPTKTKVSATLNKPENHEPTKTKVFAILTKPENRCGVETAKKLVQRNATLRVYFAYFRKYKLRRVMRELKSFCYKGAHVEFVPYESPLQLDMAIRENKIDGILINKHGCNSPQDGRGETDELGLLPFAKHKLVDNANLINRFMQSGKLQKGSRVIVSGSEAARGIPSMGFPIPSFGEPADVKTFMSCMDGTGFKHDANMGYSYHMAMSALMIKAIARQRPDIYFASVSPGFTRDSLRPGNVAGVPSFVYVAQFAMSLMFPILKLFGVGYSCNAAADRFVDALVNDNSWKYPNGTAVGAMEGVSGPFGDQTSVPSGEFLGDEKLQDLALQAVSQYMEEDWYL